MLCLQHKVPGPQVACTLDGERAGTSEFPKQFEGRANLLSSAQLKYGVFYSFGSVYLRLRHTRGLTSRLWFQFPPAFMGCSQFKVGQNRLFSQMICQEFRDVALVSLTGCGTCFGLQRWLAVVPFKIKYNFISNLPPTCTA